NTKNFLLVGERGIGKTSLLLYARYSAESVLEPGSTALPFLVVRSDITPATTQEILVRKIELALRAQLERTDAARGLLRKVWEFCERLEIGGSKLTERKHEACEEILVEEYARSIAATAKAISGDGAELQFLRRYAGIIIILDEVDNASSSLSLGAFVKL